MFPPFGTRRLRLGPMCLFICVLCDISRAAFASNERIEIRGNGYRGIVVAIEPDIAKKRSDLSQILNSMEDIFRRASSYLFRATQRRAFFEEITILLPRDTPVSFLTTPGSNVSNAFEKFTDADFVVRSTGSGPFSRNGAPFTLQYGGCGQPGKYIHIPLEFFIDKMEFHFDEIYGCRHKVLVHEWAHYRYGVFDEYGFPGDDRYPPLFAVPDGDDTSTSAADHIRVTACTNAELAYDIFPSQKECMPNLKTGFVPEKCGVLPKSEDPEINKTHSSIMYHQRLPNIDYFCNSSSHKEAIPTKHNALCQERSTWAVIKDSPDLKDANSQVNVQNEVPTKFRYVVETLPQVMVAFDRNGPRPSDYRYRFRFLAWRTFLEALPESSTVSLIGYNDVKVLLPPTIFNTEQLDELASKSYDFRASGKDAVICIQCVVSKAVEFLKDTVGGIVVLQVDARNVTIEEDLQSSLDLLLQHQLHLHLILYHAPEAGNTLVGELTRMALATRGNVYSVLQEDDNGGIRSIKSLLNLLDAFEDVARGYSWDREHGATEIKCTEIPIPSETTIEFEFDVDGSLSECQLEVAVISQVFAIGRKPLINATLTAPDGSVCIFDFWEDWCFRREESLSDAFIISREKFKAGRWNLTVPKILDVFWGSQLFIRARALRNEKVDMIAVDSWTNLPVSEDSNGSAPLIVYANVHKGMKPVRNALVQANVYKRNGELLQTYNLVDDGLGDPDITRWDGIYSSYITSGSKEGGHHQVEIIVKGTEETELLDGWRGKTDSLLLKAGYHSCCGSFVRPENTKRTGRFDRRQNLFYVYVPPTFDEKNSSFSPPSRITDLRVTNVDLASARVTLSWTSPGGERNRGQVDEYEIKLGTSRNEIRDGFDRVGNINATWDKDGSSTSKPKAYGNGEVRIVNLQTLFNTTYERLFFGIRAVKYGGSEGRINGPVSNIVEVDLRKMPWNIRTTTDTDSTLSTTAGEEKQAFSQMDLAVGITVALVFMPLIIAIFFMFKRKKENESGASTDSVSNLPPE